MQASTIAHTAITSVQVIPFAMKPAFSRIQAVSKSAAAKSPTSSGEDHRPHDGELQPERDARGPELEGVAPAALFVSRGRGGCAT